LLAQLQHVFPNVQQRVHGRIYTHTHTQSARQIMRRRIGRIFIRYRISAG
jgi:hypothetical protein